MMRKIREASTFTRWREKDSCIPPLKQQCQSTAWQQLTLLCTGCWGKRYIPSRLEKRILSYRGWGGWNISRRGLPDIWWTFKQRAVQSNNTSVDIECVHMTSRQPCWRSKQRNGGHLGGVKTTLCKSLLLFHYANMASGHMSEHTL